MVYNYITQGRNRASTCSVYLEEIYTTLKHDQTTLNLKIISLLFHNIMTTNDLKFHRYQY